MINPRFPTRTIWMGPPLAASAKKIVSLVPSLTEAVFLLGARDRLAARTEYCVRPRGIVESIETVGGTKNPKNARIVEIAPDVILANKEENRKKHIEDLAQHFPVWLTDPVGPADVPALWAELGELTGLVAEGARLASEVANALAAANAAASQMTRRPRFLYFVWKDPWMAAGHDTYISNLLCAGGFANALAPHHTRFPTLNVAEIADVERDVTIYSSEPYNFELPRDLIDGPGEAAEKDWYHVPSGLAAFVDAEPLSWYPSLTIEGLEYATRLAARAVSLEK